MRHALAKLTKTGAPFTVEDVCNLAGVGKTFVYDKRRPDLTMSVLTARDASQRGANGAAQQTVDAATASWRERALNAEAHAKSLRSKVMEREALVSDLTGQLFDPEGKHLVEHNAELRRAIQDLSKSLRESEIENAKLRRSMEAARAQTIAASTTSPKSAPESTGRDPGDWLT